jgi:hypothetical protein
MGLALLRRPWSAADDAALAHLVAFELSTDAIARRLRRTGNGVQHRIRHLGLHKKADLET